MEVIKTHKIAFLILLLAIICLIFAILMTVQKYEDTEIIDNSTLMIYDKEENIKVEESNDNKKTLAPVQILEESSISSIPWSFSGEVNNKGEYVQDREIYGLDITIEYNEKNDTYIATAEGIGDDDKIQYYTLSNDKLILAVPADVPIKNTGYGINFNRISINESSTPENWCYDYEKGAEIRTENDMKLIEIPFNRNYGKGELLNLDLQFGLLP